MKMVMRPRYYCDFCKKAGGNPGAIQRHESSCTANPERICRLCVGINGGTGNLEEGKAAWLNPALGSDWKAKMQALRDATKNCPACILAVLRQTGATTPAPPDEAGYGGFPEGTNWQSDLGKGDCLYGFDFKAEMHEAMEEFRARADQERYC